MMLGPCPMSRHRRIRTQGLLAMAVLGGAAMLGCAHHRMIPGTSVPDTDDNQAILKTIETYRARLVEKNVDGLLVLASDKYFEDSGTPRADDDYGYQGLREVLTTSLQRV